MTGRETLHEAQYVTADPGDPPLADSPAARVALGWLLAGAEILRRRGELDVNGADLEAKP